VPLSPSPKRDWNEYAPSKAPEPSDIWPRPSLIEPSQSAFAVRAAMTCLLRRLRFRHSALASSRLAATLPPLAWQAMSRNQRLSFLGIATAIAVVAIVIFVVSGSGSEDTSDQAATTPTATATAEGTETPTTTPTPTPQPPLLQAGSVKKLSYKEGDTVTFRVRNDAPEEVHVHGYDIKKELEPNKTATVSFKASITGIFEIELEGSATQLAELRVDPK
jgi:hypothetical protein